MEFINKIRGDADFNWREMERKLVAMVKERNRFSISKGYKSRVDMALKNYKISNLEYKCYMIPSFSVLWNTFTGLYQGF